MAQLALQISLVLVLDRLSNQLQVIDAWCTVALRYMESQGFISKADIDQAMRDAAFIQMETPTLIMLRLARRWKKHAFRNRKNINRK